MNDDALDELRQALTQGWNLSATSGCYADLRESLARRVAFLLKHQHDRLRAAAYLLDISEIKFQAAMALENNAEKVLCITDLILEREEEKAESRRRYRRENSIDIGPEDGL